MNKTNAATIDELKEEFQKELDSIKKHPRLAVKYGINLIVSSCASTVAGLVIHTLLPKDMLSKKQKLQVAVAAWAIGGSVASQAGRWATEESTISTVLYHIADKFKKAEQPKTTEEPDPGETGKDESYISEDFSDPQ